MEAREQPCRSRGRRSRDRRARGRARLRGSGAGCADLRDRQGDQRRPAPDGAELGGDPRGPLLPPGSLKAQLCREGRDLLISYADERGIPYRLPGKLVVALDEGEIPRLDELVNRGRSNGLSGLRELGPDEMREIEPHVAGIRAIHVPETGIIDYVRVANAFADDVRSGGGEVLLGQPGIGYRDPRPRVRRAARTPGMRLLPGGWSSAPACNRTGWRGLTGRRRGSLSNRPVPR